MNTKSRTIAKVRIIEQGINPLSDFTRWIEDALNSGNSDGPGIAFPFLSGGRPAVLIINHESNPNYIDPFKQFENESEL